MSSQVNSVNGFNSQFENTNIQQMLFYLMQKVDTLQNNMNDFKKEVKEEITDLRTRSKRREYNGI